jgi:hypothetical protein
LLESLLAIALALKALSDLLSEDHLDSKQRDLGLVLVNEFLKAHSEALSGSSLANVAHGKLH